MSKFWKVLIWGVLIVGVLFYFIKPKRRIKRRKGMKVVYRRKKKSAASRYAAFVPKSRGKSRTAVKKGMRRLNGRWYTNKAWGAAMQRLRKRRA